MVPPKSAGREARTRPGCSRALTRATSRGVTLHVVADLVTAPLVRATLAAMKVRKALVNPHLKHTLHVVADLVTAPLVRATLAAMKVRRGFRRA